MAGLSRLIPGPEAEDTAAHVPECDNPGCEGYDAEAKRPLLSFECWDVWAFPEARR